MFVTDAADGLGAEHATGDSSMAGPVLLEKLHPPLVDYTSRIRLTASTLATSSALLLEVFLVKHVPASTEGQIPHARTGSVLSRATNSCLELRMLLWC